MALTDMCVAVRGNRPMAVISKSDTDSYLALKGVSIKKIEDYVTGDKLLDQVQQLVSTCGYEFIGCSENDEYIVEIHNGDWKRDHLYMDDVMWECFNASCARVSEIGSSGDDGYSAQRFYKIK